MGVRGGRSGSNGPMYRRRINVSEEKWRLRNLLPGLLAMMVSTRRRPHNTALPPHAQASFNVQSIRQFVSPFSRCASVTRPYARIFRSKWYNSHRMNTSTIYGEHVVIIASGNATKLPSFLNLLESQQTPRRGSDMLLNRAMRALTQRSHRASIPFRQRRFE